MDCLLMSEKLINNEPISLFAVCDGVGSTAGGGETSTFCVRFLERWFNELKDELRLSIAFQESILLLQKELSAFLLKNNLKGASTLSALLLYKNNYYIVNLGDSRVYGMNEGYVEQLTLDQIDSQGRLIEYLGKSTEVFLYYREGKRKYLHFLVCSDGFYRKMNWDFFNEKIERKNIGNRLNEMVNYAVFCGETDNISVILINDDALN